MPARVSRRSFLVAAAAAAVCRSSSAAPGGRLAGLPGVLSLLEKRHGARLGVAVTDTGSGECADWRGGERFAMCSTFKWLTAAALLREADLGHVRLDQALPIPAKVTVGNSPLTLPHAGGTMNLAELARASMVRSDNTAANLLVERLGGPAALTAKWRAMGDPVTRLDRLEPILNEATPGDPRDTTTPLESARCLRRYLLGGVLAPASRAQLLAWLRANETGKDCLRAGLPADWTEGDKTGSDGRRTRNDVAIAWPPGRAPVLIAAFLAECPEGGSSDTVRNGILAEVGGLVAAALR